MGLMVYLWCIMLQSKLPSITAINGLKKLGHDIRLARLKRHLRQQRLADGAGCSIQTIRRLENGDPNVSLATFAMVLVALGEINRLTMLLDPGTDDVGLLLDAQTLPKRVRLPRQSKPQPGQSEGTSTDRATGAPDDVGEGF